MPPNEIQSDPSDVPHDPQRIVNGIKSFVPSPLNGIAVMRHHFGNGNDPNIESREGGDNDIANCRIREPKRRLHGRERGDDGAEVLKFEVTLVVKDCVPAYKGQCVCEDAYDVGKEIHLDLVDTRSYDS